LKDTENLEDL